MPSQSTSLTEKLGLQMRYLAARQSVLSQNIANIDTPGYKSKDLKKLDFNQLASAESQRLQLRGTEGTALSGNLGHQLYRTEVLRKGTDASINGNSVSLDDELVKISHTGADYEMASSLYKKYMTMFHTALGNR